MKTKTAGVQFWTLSELLDAVMLFGGDVRKCIGGGGARVIIDIATTGQRAAWLIAVLHHHNISVTIADDQPEGGGVLLESRCNPFFTASVDRWYTTRTPKIPADFTLTDELLAAWLIGNLPTVGPTILERPNITIEQAEQLAAKITRAGRVGRATASKRFKLHDAGAIELADREKVVQFLKRFAPLQLLTM